jgi:hypothetical protein
MLVFSGKPWWFSFEAWGVSLPGISKSPEGIFRDFALSSNHNVWPVSQRTALHVGGPILVPHGFVFSFTNEVNDGVVVLAYEENDGESLCKERERMYSTPPGTFSVLLEIKTGDATERVGLTYVAGGCPQLFTPTPGSR